MDKIAELRAKRAEAVDRFSALVEKMNADDTTETAEDKASYDALKAEIAGFDQKIARVEEANKVKASQAKPVDTTAEALPAMPQRRYGKLVAFTGENAERRAYRAGMFVLATMFKNEAAIDWCRANGVVIGKAQSESPNTAGGFLVPVELDQAIIDLREQYGVFRQECNVVPMGSDTISVPRRSGGVTAYFVAENGQITESQKGWDQITLTAKKLGALVRMSTELSDDAVISIADDLAQEIAWAFARKEDECGWNGDGTSTYGGILGVRTKIINGNHGAGAVVAATNHDTFAEIDAADLTSVMGALPKYAEPTAKWYVSQVGWATVFQRLVAAAGGNTIETLTGTKPRRTYLGYPVVIDQSLPTATSDISGTAMLLFGDLRLAVRMGERRGIRIKTSDDRYFEFDQIGIQATERFDINVHDLGDGTTAGPLVALVAN